MDYFKILPIELVREIISKSESLEEIAKIRRISKLFYSASLLYQDMFRVEYQKQLGELRQDEISLNRDGFFPVITHEVLIHRENLLSFMYEGFVYNFFPAVRHAAKNGEYIKCEYIDLVKSSPNEKAYCLQYQCCRLQLWTKILKHFKITSEHVHYLVYRAWLEIIYESTNGLADFYLNLLEMFLNQIGKIKIKKKYEFLQSPCMDVLIIDRIKKFNRLWNNNIQ